MKREDLSKLKFPSRPAHNFEGEPNDIVFAENDHFVSTSVGLISQYYERFSGLQILPVICFMSREKRTEVLVAILRNSMNCDTEEHGVTEPQRGKPSVKFFEPDELEGSEFGAVVILINFKHLKEVFYGLYFKFLTSVTRATTKTAIVINQDQLSEYRESENQDGSCCSFDVYETYFEEIRRESDVKTRYLLIGPKLPTVSDFERSNYQPTPIPEIPSIILYVAREGTASFWYCQDVYQWSHLEKVYDEGIRKIVILEQAFCWPFYQHSFHMISLYSNKMENAFKIRCPDVSVKRGVELMSVLGYCTEMCKNSPQGSWSNLREKWVKNQREPNHKSSAGYNGKQRLQKLTE